jgi:hypothetical protein
LFSRFLSHIDGNVVCFGLLAVAAFWFGIQLCWSVNGKRWHSVLLRLAGVVLLFGFGVVMVFFTAFGGN